MPPKLGSSAGNGGSRGGEQLLSVTFAVWQLLLCQHRIVSLTVQINQEEKSKQLGKDRAQPDSALPQGSHMFPDVFHEPLMLWRCITPLSFPDLSLLGAKNPSAPLFCPPRYPKPYKALCNTTDGSTSAKAAATRAAPDPH